MEFDYLKLRRILKRTPIIWPALHLLRLGFARIRRRLYRSKWPLQEKKFQDFLESYSLNRPDFFFVQIGANDGRLDDPLRDSILRHNWRGVLVEP